MSAKVGDRGASCAPEASSVTISEWGKTRSSVSSLTELLLRLRKWLTYTEVSTRTPAIPRLA